MFPDEFTTRFVGPKSTKSAIKIVRGKRETVPSQTSDTGKKTLSVLAH